MANIAAASLVGTDLQTHETSASDTEMRITDDEQQHFRENNQQIRLCLIDVCWDFMLLLQQNQKQTSRKQQAGFLITQICMFDSTLI